MTTTYPTLELVEVRPDSRPSTHERFFEPVVGSPVGKAWTAVMASMMIVWMLQNPEMWLHWSSSCFYPVSARCLNHERFEKWRGASGTPDGGLWIRFRA